MRHFPKKTIAITHENKWGQNQYKWAEVQQLLKTYVSTIINERITWVRAPMSMMSSLAVIFFVPVDWWMLKMDRSLDASLCAFEFITWYWWRFVWMPACANKYQLVCWSVLCVFLKYCLCMYTHIYAKHFTSYAPPPPHLQPLSDWSKCLYYSHLVYFLVIQFFAVELFLGFSTILVSLVLLLVFFECSICFFL